MATAGPISRNTVSSFLGLSGSSMDEFRKIRKNYLSHLARRAPSTNTASAQRSEMEWLLREVADVDETASRWQQSRPDRRDFFSEGSSTADELAAKLGLTAAAVRAHITTMGRDGIVRRAGHRPGTTRPSQLFELTAEVEQLLSGAYLPLLIELVRQSATLRTRNNFNELMRNTGRGLAALPDRPVPTRHWLRESRRQRLHE